MSSLRRFRALVSAPKGLNPLIHLNSSDVTDYFWPNRVAGAAPSLNLLHTASGYIVSDAGFNGSVTNSFADGPNFLKSASRVTLPDSGSGNATAVVCFRPISGKILPAGTYTYSVKLKSNTAGSQVIRYGTSNLLANMTELTLSDSSWTTLSFQFTANGTNSNTIYIASGVSAGAQDILLDEQQLYLGTTTPLFTEEVNSGAKKRAGYITPISKTGNVVSGTNNMILYAPTYPEIKTFSEFTVMVAVKVTDPLSANNLLFSTLANSEAGTATTSNYINILPDGTAYLSPSYSVGTGDLRDDNWYILGIRIGEGFGLGMINEVLTGVEIAAPSKANAYSLGCRLESTFPFTGKIAIVKIWENKMTDSEWETEVQIARTELTALGEVIRPKPWLLAEGDSITAYTNSFTRKQITETFSGDKLGLINIATGGHTLSIVESDLSDTIARIESMKRGGGTAILSLLIGRNDKDYLEASSANRTAYYNRLKSYWSSCRNAGAKVIACTMLPAGTAVGAGAGSAYETARLAMNDLIRSDLSQFDGLADLGSDSLSIMGDVATADNVTYYADGVHPTDAGHELLKPILTSVIDDIL